MLKIGVGRRRKNQSSVSKQILLGYKEKSEKYVTTITSHPTDSESDIAFFYLLKTSAKLIKCTSTGVCMLYSYKAVREAEINRNPK